MAARGRGQKLANARIEAILEALARAHPEPVRVKDLGAAAGVSSGYMSDLIALMLRRGLIEWRPKGYALTPRGLADRRGSA